MGGAVLALSGRSCSVGTPPRRARVPVLGALVLAYGLLLVLQPLPRGLGEPLSWGVQSVTVLVAAGALLRRGRAASGRLRHARALVAGSLGAGALGGVLAILWLVVTGAPAPDPSVVDLVHFCFLPLVVAALLRYPVSDTSAGSASRALLDGTVAAGALWFVAYELLLGPFSVGEDLPVLARLTTLAYPAADVFVLAMVASVLPRVAREVRRELALTGSGLAVFAVADLAYTVEFARGSYRADSWVGVLYEAGTAARARRRPRGRRRLPRRTPLHRRPAGAAAPAGAGRRGRRRRRGAAGPRRRPRAARHRRRPGGRAVPAAPRRQPRPRRPARAAAVPRGALPVAGHRRLGPHHAARRPGPRDLDQPGGRARARPAGLPGHRPLARGLRRARGPGTAARRLRCRRQRRRRLPPGVHRPAARAGRRAALDARAAAQRAGAAVGAGRRADDAGRPRPVRPGAPARARRLLRRADRPGQPRPRPRAADRLLRRAAPGHRRARRPRRLQGGQRHLRPRARRRAAAGGRRAADLLRARPPTR